MKNVKKLLSIVMVLTLVLSLGASAFAAAAGTTVTIEDASNGHTYTAYQVFKGTTARIDGTERLASIEWANEAGAEELLKALKADTTIGGLFKDVTTAEEAAEAISGMDSTQAQQLGRVLIANKGLLGEGIAIEGGKTVLDAGYYAIEDTTDPLAPADSRNAIVLEVVGDDVVVNKKYDVPSSEKKVKDVNDSTGEATDWQDSADYDIGDTIPYQLKATLPKNMGEYVTYYLEFVDNLSKGLTYNNDAKIYFVQGEDKIDITSAFSITPSDFEGAEPAYAGGTVVLMECTDLKSIEALAGKDLNGAQIVVEYSATLEDDAVIGADGNPNRMHIVFSNNPGGEGHGATPDDTVIVFTFDFDMNKVDEKKLPLSGAAFSLYKEVKTPVAGVEYTYLDADYNVVEAGTEGAKPYEKKTLTVNGNVFSADGLDDGNYVLVEDSAPNGYNKAAPIPFSIVATHDEKADTPTLGTLEVKDAEGNVISSGEGASFKVDLGKGNVSTDVVNQSGVELPETGGIGTTIFYIVGAVLVAGAVILLVTKKRVSGAEK